MTTHIHRALMLLLAKRPLAVLRFEDGFGEALLHSRHGVNRFTIVRPHEELDDLKLPTLCLVEMPYGKDRECHVGVITTKAAIATFESRLTIIRLQSLQLASIQSIVARLGTQQFRTSLKAKLDKSSVVSCLSPRLSIDIIKVLSKSAEDKKAIEKAFDDYRLNRGPFYFKFVKRKGTGKSHQGYTIILDHLNEILKSPESRGERGGVRVSYEALGRSYLRETDLIGLIHSGYIGTHRVESQAGRRARRQSPY